MSKQEPTDSTWYTFSMYLDHAKWWGFVKKDLMTIFSNHNILYIVTVDIYTTQVLLNRVPEQITDDENIDTIFLLK